MKAREIMSPNVITVSPTTAVRDIAALMTEKRISGIPVVSKDGKVVGIVSESDLLHRAEMGTEPKRKWWLTFFSDPDAMAREYTKTHGLQARDVMSRQVISVAEDDDLKTIADTLDGRKVKRVPVLRDGKLAGIISRADLVRAFSQMPVARTASPAGDAALEQMLLQKMRAQDWLDGTYLSVSVRDGVVELRGFIGSAEQRRALRVLIDEIDGVSRVNDQLTVGMPTLSAG
ncbi:MAG: CBS domain-containing protein [Hyphomicrobiaceae bacterium]|nr:CBS domain-containing protein [Hyphomicrobiaceae bacterium]